MANCELCGKSIAFMGGGKEPYTGKGLYVCNECGTLFKNLDLSKRERDIEKFKVINAQMLNLVKGRNTEKTIEEFFDSLERQIIDRKRQDAEKEQIEINKKIVAQQYGELKASFLSTTGYNFEGYNIEEYLGIVSGQAVLGTGFLSEIFASASDTFGTESNAFSKKIREAKELAFEDMQKEALYKGANAIIGMDLDIMTIGNNMIAVSGNATAVKIKKVD